MKRIYILSVTLATVFSILLSGCYQAVVKAPTPATLPTAASTTEVLPQETTAAPTEETAETTFPEETTPSAAEDTTPATEETASATEETTSGEVEIIAPPPEAEGELEEERFTLTFLGDCTIGSQPIQMNVMYSILWFIGEDYTYPFKGVIDYIDDDDLTVINLEGTFCDPMPNSGALFTFRAPTNYVNVLTENSIEVASFANNHTMDYLQKGYDSTLATLEEAGIPYVEKDSSTLVTTKSGLTVGFYALSFSMNKADMQTEIAQLRKDGAEVVVVSAHWGAEGSYRAAQTQIDIAHAAIDAGADIVYGHHPHVLQKIEEYNDGIIYYSLGNFVFGGHHWPQDLDSAVLQQEIIRSPEGEISLGELTIIPVSCSSLPAQNDFQPTPYEEGSEKYERVMSKLDGTFKGRDLVVNYD